jgi:hypothetical protein
MNPDKALWEKGDFTRIAKDSRSDLGCGFGDAMSIPATFLRATVAV